MSWIVNQTNVTLENITSIVNLTTSDPIEFFINANNTIYGGWFFFVILCVLGFILWKKAQDLEDQPLINVMYVLAALTILSFVLRAIYIVKNGVPMGLMTDYQMWLFPLFTAITAAIVKAMSD